MTFPGRAPAASDVWLTPPEILRDLGPFDLDPCAAPMPRPWPTAARHLVEADDGLYAAWEGFVWLNPPYGRETWRWLSRLAGHATGGIALTFARTSTGDFQDQAFKRATGMLFIRGHLHFHHPDGRRARFNAGAPSVLIGYQDDALRRLALSSIAGHLVVSSAILLTADGKPAETWRDAVAAALAGRTLRLRDIYAAAEPTDRVRAAKARGHNWRAQIRRALQEYFRPVDYGVWAPA